MSGRLDRVSVETIRGPLEITWDARDELLDQIRNLDSMQPLREAFEAVGATRPVVIPTAMKDGLLTVLHTWARDIGGIENLPDGLTALRHALADENAADPYGFWD